MVGRGALEAAGTEAVTTLVTEGWHKNAAAWPGRGHAWARRDRPSAHWIHRPPNELSFHSLALVVLP